MSATAAAAEDVPFGDDEIFFGSVPVALATVPGHCEVYDHAHAAFATDPEEIAVSLARAGKLTAGGRTNVVVPCMPCADIRQPSPPSTDVSAWPELLQKPLLKVPLGCADAIPGVKAVASGCRSCLVKLPAAGGGGGGANANWFRLKGSGNHDQGFLLKEDRALDIVQIRGSAFSHTAARENYMTSKLGAELSGEAVAANGALGCFVYGPPNQPLGDEPAAGGAGVSVVPTCIVQRTLGDRRLGSHLLAGLSVLLPQFVGGGGGGGGGGAESGSGSESAKAPLDLAALTALFPELRPRDPSEPDVPVTTAVLMTVSCGGGIIGVVIAVSVCGVDVVAVCAPREGVRPACEMKGSGVSVEGSGRNEGIVSE